MFLSSSNFLYSPIQNPATERSEGAIKMSKTVKTIYFVLFSVMLTYLVYNLQKCG